MRVVFYGDSFKQCFQYLRDLEASGTSNTFAVRRELQQLLLFLDHIYPS